MDVCDIAIKNTTSYACISGNSNCVDDIKGGYRCKCSHGYEGNPYIKDGCKDINECLDNATYPCMGICKNTIGSFDCSCYPGSYMKNGFCLPNQKSTFPARHVIGIGSFLPYKKIITCVGINLKVVIKDCAHITHSILDFKYKSSSLRIENFLLFKEHTKRKLQHIKNNYFQQHGGLILFEEMKSQQGHAFKIFSEEELQQATKKFNEQEILGQGGNGIVYKGLLKSNSEVAVKKCMTIDEQKKKEFGKEMLILSQTNHKNIVKLLGCCLEVEVPMLVYEFIPNGTLFHLIHENHGNHISLITRLRIAHESAEALAYLHSCASPPILHGDVKSSNILLDNNFSAKVSDFGASILAPTDEMQFVTLVQGTCGYLDPEYMQTCQLTDKSDVYSFGVVLLELLTRKKAFNLDAPEHEKVLSMMFLSAMKENKLEDMLDDQIKNNENMEFLEEMAELARKCLDMSSINRPSMKEIGDELGRLRKVMEHQCAKQNPEEMESFLGDSSYVINSTVESTKSFSIEKNAMKRLKSGR
uniref:Protein kinase domain-containing protein n=1 Tax=Oryza rufipogon TaxID=4529 RepID=A0A0E0QQM3_ORYRU